MSRESILVVDRELATNILIEPLAKLQPSDSATSGMASNKFNTQAIMGDSS